MKVFCDLAGKLGVSICFARILIQLIGFELGQSEIYAVRTIAIGVLGIGLMLMSDRFD